MIRRSFLSPNLPGRNEIYGKHSYICGAMKDDAILIKGLNMSDREAFGCLYDKYVKMVYGFLMSLLKDQHLAEDLTQWCFVQLWEHRAGITVDRNLPAWLYVTARNAAYKELRRQLTAARYVDYALNDKEKFDVVSTPLSDIKVITDEMSKVVDRLPESRKRIFLMRTVEGMSVNEIARILKISPKTVETQIARAKAALRKSVSELLFIAIVLSFGL